MNLSAISISPDLGSSGSVPLTLPPFHLLFCEPLSPQRPTHFKRTDNVGSGDSPHYQYSSDRPGNAKQEDNSLTTSLHLDNVGDSFPCRFHLIIRVYVH